MKMSRQDFWSIVKSCHNERFHARNANYEVGSMFQQEIFQ